MAHHKSVPRWAQWTAGSVLVSVAVAAGVTSLVINVVHGWESGLATAITFGHADVGKIVIPMVAVAIGWKWQTKLTLAVCAIVSLVCAGSYYLNTSGQALLNRQQAMTTANDMAKRVAELEAEMATANALANTETKIKGCGPKCESFRQQAHNASQRLQEAREARAAIPIRESSGLAVLASLLTHTSASEAARWETGLKALLSILLLETLVYLSIPGGQMIGMAMARPTVTTIDHVAPSVELKAIPRQRDAKGRFLPRPAEVPVVQLTRVREAV